MQVEHGLAASRRNDHGAASRSESSWRATLAATTKQVAEQGLVGLPAASAQIHQRLAWDHPVT